MHMRQLTEFTQGRRQLAPGEPPLGGWCVMRALANPKTDNVLPNVDTLYGAAYLLLDRQGPVVLDVPPIPDRYYSVAHPGRLLQQLRHRQPADVRQRRRLYLLAPPGWTGQAPEGIAAVFEAPTPALCLLQRIFTRDSAEYETLHALQDAIRLTPLDRWRAGESGFPPVGPGRVRESRPCATRDPLRSRVHRLLHRVQYAAGGGRRPGGVVPDGGGRARLASARRPAPARGDHQGAADAQAIMNARLSDAPVRDGWRVPTRTWAARGRTC